MGVRSTSERELMRMCPVHVCTCVGDCQCAYMRMRMCRCVRMYGACILVCECIYSHTVDCKSHSWIHSHRTHSSYSTSLPLPSSSSYQTHKFPSSIFDRIFSSLTVWFVVLHSGLWFGLVRKLWWWLVTSARRQSRKWNSLSPKLRKF